MDKRLQSRSKKAKSGDKESKAEVALIERLLPHLNEGKPALTLDMSDEERLLLKEFFLLSSKKSIFACNVSEDELAGALENPDAHEMVAKVRAYASETQGAEAVVLSAQIEEELSELSPEEAKEFLTDMGISDSGAAELIKGVYHLLGLRTYLTTGEQETRAWTITAGDKAPAAAGVIHTDFEKQFIRAEDIHYDDYVTHKTVAAARDAGVLRAEGKEYEVQDGDVINFLTGA